ncbi:MAG TPA: hypothetical protein VLJ42_13030 [Solirubrobacteraceae bacterium]|nr:hypothetical protein [Solirubrobacteraceae bacterium]
MEIIPVVYHSEPEGWWADSPKIPEWTAAASSLDELRRLVEEGVRFALDRDDVFVEHYLLGYGTAVYAELVFDFVSDQTVVNQGPNAAHRAHLTLAA